MKRRRRSAARRPGTDATSMVLTGFVGVAVLFVGTATVINVGVHDMTDASAASASPHGTFASLLLDRIMQPGIGWYPPGICGQDETAPQAMQSEAVEQFGLGIEPCGDAGRTNQMNVLDWAKTDRLVPSGQGQAYTPADLTYDEARRALGLGPTGLDFRLTFDPILNAAPLRVAYIAHFDLNVECTNVSDLVCSAVQECLEETSEEAWYVDCAALLLVDPDMPEVPEGPDEETPLLMSGPTAPTQPTRKARSAEFGSLGRASFMMMGDCAIACVEFEWRPHDAAYREFTYLRDMLNAFTARVPSAGFESSRAAYGLDADVYPDHPVELSLYMQDRTTDDDGAPWLEEYNVVVVGSRADNEALTTASSALRDWVDVGGTLVVLGGEGRIVWTQEDFGWTQRSALATQRMGSGSDSLLTAPNGVPFDAYPAPKRSFQATATGTSAPAHPADVRAALRDETTSVLLGTSHRRVFDDGFLVLTGYQPWNLREVGNPKGDSCDVVQGIGPSREACDGFKLLENLVMTIYDNARLSFGPAPPAGAEVVSASGIASMMLPTDIWADVRVRLEVFGAIDKAGGIDAPERCQSVSGLAGTITVSTATSVSDEQTLIVRVCKGDQITIDAPEGLTVGTYQIVRDVSIGDQIRYCDDIVGTQPGSHAVCEVMATETGLARIRVRVDDSVGNGSYDLSVSLSDRPETNLPT